MIKINNLKKVFDNKTVLSEMSINIDSGTIFGLIGSNGSGKSTLLRLLSGVISPDGGSIEIENIILSDEVSLRHKIFYLSDNPPHGNFTTFNDLYELYSMFYSMDESIYKEILNMFNLDAGLELSKCSKGMKRQGYLALAFATNAKYLLLDEAFDGLDPKARLKFRQYLMKQFDEDKIIIISSHSLRELEDVCDSFGLIDNGHFISYGNISEVISHVKKYRVISSHTDHKVYNNEADFLHIKKDGRVYTLFEHHNRDIHDLLIKEHVLAVDALEMTFEEYFIIQDKAV